MRSPQAALPPCRGLRRAEAARYVGVSASKFDGMVRDGRMPRPFHVDACTIWDVRDLDPAIDELKDLQSRNPWDKGVAA
jgi:predicted DNA-binding transcriptional regulator AlpA